MQVKDIYSKEDISKLVRAGLLISKDVNDHWSSRDELEIYMKYNYAEYYANQRNWNSDISWNRRYEYIAKMSPREVIILALGG